MVTTFPAGKSCHSTPVHPSHCCCQPQFNSCRSKVPFLVIFKDWNFMETKMLPDFNLFILLIHTTFFLLKTILKIFRERITFRQKNIYAYLKAWQTQSLAFSFSLILKSTRGKKITLCSRTFRIPYLPCFIAPQKHCDYSFSSSHQGLIYLTDE